MNRDSSQHQPLRFRILARPLECRGLCVCRSRCVGLCTNGLCIQAVKFSRRLGYLCLCIKRLRRSRGILHRRWVPPKFLRIHLL